MRSYIQLSFDNRTIECVVSDTEVVPFGEVDFVEGVSGCALSLGGGENAVLLSNLPLRNDPASGISVTCWFKSEKKLPAGSPIISRNGQNSGWELSLSGDNNTVGFLVRDLRVSVQGLIDTDSVYGTTGISDGRWHHLAGIYDGKTIAIYVDGRMEQIGRTSGEVPKISAPIAIGARVNEEGMLVAFGSFVIDGVRVFDKAIDHVVIAGLSKSSNRPQVEVRRKTVDLDRNFLSRGVFPILAHRGGGVDLPENTLETFREVWGMGMIPEVDIRTTEDDVIICMHDKDVGRLAPDAPEPLKYLTFDQMTMDQVKSLDVGSFRGRPGQRVPTLEEVFVEMSGHPERMVYMDYKNVTLERLADLVIKYGLNDQVIFTTRYHHLIREWCSIVPNSVTMLWMGGDEYAVSKMIEQVRREQFAGISILQIIIFDDPGSVDGFYPSVDYLRQCASELAARGVAMQLIPWEISEKAVFDRLLREGFRYFATDYPEVARRAYKDTLELH